MALTIITTAGATDANSYVSEEEWTAYFETKYYGASFLELTSEQQKQIAIESARLIDTYFYFNGFRTNQSPRQALEFPRKYLYECDGSLVDSETIPLGVKNAQCEQMLYFMSTNPISPVYNKYKNVSVGKGAVAVEYNLDLKYKTINNIVSDMLRCYGSPTGNATGDCIGSMRVTRS